MKELFKKAAERIKRVVSDYPQLISPQSPTVAEQIALEKLKAISNELIKEIRQATAREIGFDREQDLVLSRHSDEDESEKVTLSEAYYHTVIARIKFICSNCTDKEGLIFTSYKRPPLCTDYLPDLINDLVSYKNEYFDDTKLSAKLEELSAGTQDVIKRLQAVLQTTTEQLDKTSEKLKETERELEDAKRQVVIYKTEQEQLRPIIMNLDLGELSLEAIEKLADYFNVSKQDLLGGPTAASKPLPAITGESNIIYTPITAKEKYSFVSAPIDAMERANWLRSSKNKTDYDKQKLSNVTSDAMYGAICKLVKYYDLLSQGSSAGPGLFDNNRNLQEEKSAVENIIYKLLDFALTDNAEDYQQISWQEKITIITSDTDLNMSARLKALMEKIQAFTWKDDFNRKLTLMDKLQTLYKPIVQGNFLPKSDTWATKYKQRIKPQTQGLKQTL